jgi:hypothetical protein
VTICFSAYAVSIASRPSRDSLRHDEHLKRRPRLQRVHQAEKAGAVGELGAADGVVDVDVRVVDRPAFRGSERARVLNLARRTSARRRRWFVQCFFRRKWRQSSWSENTD